MLTLSKKQHSIYKKLCDQYNKTYYNICSFDNYLKGQVNKAYENIRYEFGHTREYYENLRAVQIYAENDY